MACDLPTKEDFIKAFNETFERIVYPIVENTISNIFIVSGVKRWMNQ